MRPQWAEQVAELILWPQSCFPPKPLLTSTYFSPTMCVLSTRVSSNCLHEWLHMCSGCKTRQQVGRRALIVWRHSGTASAGPGAPAPPSWLDLKGGLGPQLTVSRVVSGGSQAQQQALLYPQLVSWCCCCCQLELLLLSQVDSSVSLTRALISK